LCFVGVIFEVFYIWDPSPSSIYFTPLSRVMFSIHCILVVIYSFLPLSVHLILMVLFLNVFMESRLFLLQFMAFFGLSSISLWLLWVLLKNLLKQALHKITLKLNWIIITPFLMFCYLHCKNSGIYNISYDVEVMMCWWWLANENEEEKIGGLVGVEIKVGQRWRCRCFPPLFSTPFFWQFFSCICFALLFGYLNSY
jgi:hypothetical protein